MQRKTYSPELKAKITLEAIKELRTVAELAAAYDVHPSVIKRWKRQVLEQMPSLFSSRKQRFQEKQQEELTATLYQQIGQLKVELDWLKKKSGLLG
jgi:putative transposase